MFVCDTTVTDKNNNSNHGNNTTIAAETHRKTARSRGSVTFADSANNDDDNNALVSSCASTGLHWQNSLNEEGIVYMKVTAALQCYVRVNLNFSHCPHTEWHI